MDVLELVSMQMSNINYRWWRANDVESSKISFVEGCEDSNREIYPSYHWFIL